MTSDEPYKVEFTNEAWAAVEAQVRYIAVERMAPENAGRWLVRLLAAVKTLENLPKRHRVDQRQTAATGTEIRRLVFERTYLLFYTVDDVRRRVDIVSFRHGAKENPAGN
jgi:plasmid stabilization system protein ParE